jgi:hypothetical protein
MPSIARALNAIRRSMQEEMERKMGDVIGQDWLDEVQRRIDKRMAKITNPDSLVLTLNAAIQAIKLDSSFGMRSVNWADDYIFVKNDVTLYYYNPHVGHPRPLVPELDLSPHQGDSWILIKRVDPDIKRKYPRMIMVKQGDEE